jgi:hypothetical protein
MVKGKKELVTKHSYQRREVCVATITSPFYWHHAIPCPKCPLLLHAAHCELRSEQNELTPTNTILA